MDQKTALQFLPNEMEGDSTARTRLVHEARSAAALDHSYICHINEVGASDGRAFIARGYLSDWSLKERLRAGLSPRNEGLQQAIEMAKVLETGHAKRIILRDIQ